MGRKRPRIDLEAELARLEAMDAASLRAAFTERRGMPAPKSASGRFLRYVLAHDLQVAHLGPEPKRVTRAYRRIGAALAAGQGAEAAVKGMRVDPSRGLTPGAKLLRDYAGQTHEITVIEDGFVWAGRCWRSLSAIAREITGQRRNGPAFFGLSDPGEPERGADDAPPL